MPETTKPYRIILANRAATDLDRIFNYLVDRTPQHAPAVIDQILASIERLADFPHRTIVAEQPPEAKSPVRSLPVPPYVIFFRIVEDQHTVRVLRVRHGARRPLKRFE
jgi:plasmid stabilization system protein ParE